MVGRNRIQICYHMMYVSGTNDGGSVGNISDEKRAKKLCVVHYTAHTYIQTD
jgi:hypothetical protein